MKSLQIMQEDWDYLIILDACRYDYFSKLCGEYLQGDLKKACSPASCTTEWCRRSFKEYNDDVVYVSANPHINSRTGGQAFIAKDYFFRVIDIWDYGWDEGLGTVHPQEVTKAAQNLKDRYSGKRLIIHYMQPHAPYLTYHRRNVGFSRPRPIVTRDAVLTRIGNDGTRRIVEEKTVRFLASLAKGIGLFSGNPSWKIRELLNLRPASPMDAFRRKVGDSGLRQAYTRNLRLVLTHVARLSETLPGVIVVTSDHGELLGEDGQYAHPCGSANPLLREVPWLIIERKEGEKDIREKRRISQRIRLLRARSSSARASEKEA